MPHFIIEVAQPLLTEKPANIILESIEAAALESQLFMPEDIKCRIQLFEHYDCGQEGLRFIHVVAKLLTGRTLAQKQALSSAIIEHLNHLGFINISLTAEVVDIERESYAKQVNSV